jgi:hypothetical protein
MASADVRKDLHGLFRGAVDLPHDGWRQIGSDWHGGHINGSEPSPNLRKEGRIVSRVAGKEEMA